jgi:flagellar hook-associated protein 1 FlgK
MAVGLLGTAASGLLTFQRAIGVAGHNIANANTEGYTRQRVELGTRAPSFTGQGFIGNGVQVESIERLYDKFQVDNLRNAISSSRQFDTFASFSARVSNLLGDADAGLNAGLESFFDSVQGLSNDPSSIPARQVMLTEADSLSARFHSLNNQLNDIRNEVNGGLSNMVAEINSLSSTIADANRQIVDARSAGSGEAPNDLMDARDRLITRLSELVDVRAVQQEDGSVNVTIGTGQPLVTRFLPSSLEIVKNDFDARRLEIAISTGNVSSVITDNITGGEMGAVLDFRDQVLGPSQNALGRIAVTVALEFNSKHQLGMDLDGNAGKQFFDIGTPLTSRDVNNISQVNVTASFDQNNISQLTTSDYTLGFDGTIWSMQRVSDGKIVPMSGTGVPGDPFVVDGLNIVVNGSAAAGDRFQIQPTRSGSPTFQLRPINVREIAAASPVSVGENTNANGVPINAGNGAMALTGIDSGSSSLSSGISLTYDATAQQFNYTGDATGSFAYDPAVDSGTEFTVAGVSFVVSGIPANTDSFNIQANQNGTGDNTNILMLSDLQTGLTMEGGSASFENAYAQLIGDVSTRTRTAQITAEAQTALQRQAQETVDAKSGVNLDEEAADLIRYQQAYQALARLITIADETFQSLLNAVGR